MERSLLVALTIWNIITYMLQIFPHPKELEIWHEERVLSMCLTSHKLEYDMHQVGHMLYSMMKNIL